MTKFIQLILNEFIDAAMAISVGKLFQILTL